MFRLNCQTFTLKHIHRLRPTHPPAKHVFISLFPSLSWRIDAVVAAVVGLMKRHQPGPTSDQLETPARLQSSGLRDHREHLKASVSVSSTPTESCVFVNQRSVT